jgi:hypothetical protein
MDRGSLISFDNKNPRRRQACPGVDARLLFITHYAPLYFPHAPPHP